MELKSPLSSSQNPNTCPYTESPETSLCSSISCNQDPFNFIFPSPPTSTQVVYFLHISDQHPAYTFPLFVRNLHMPRFTQVSYFHHLDII